MFSKLVMVLLVSALFIVTAWAQGGGDKVGNGNNDYQALAAVQYAEKAQVNSCYFPPVSIYEVCDALSRIEYFNPKQREVWGRCCE